MGRWGRVWGSIVVGCCGGGRCGGEVGWWEGCEVCF